MVGILSALDVSIVVAYLVGCLVVAFWKAAEIKTIREYTLGSGSVSTLVLVCTIFATYLSASSTIGTVEKIYTLGLFFAIARVAGPLVWLIMAKVYIHIDQFAGCLSICDVADVLYGKVGRWIATIASLILSVGSVATQALAMGYMFDYFLKIGQLEGIILGVGILTFYSAFGGIRAVALTDVLQFFVFYIAIPSACLIALHDVGGIQALYHNLPRSHVTLNLEGKQLWFFLSLSVFILPFNGGAFIQRFLMSSNPKQLAKSLKVIALLHLPLAIFICLIGFIMKVQAPDLEPQFVFMTFMEKYLFSGVKGLLIAGMIAVMMSTADSWLNTASVLCAHDIGRKLYPALTDAQQLLIARICTLLIGVGSIFIAAAASGILELYWLVYNFWDTIMMIPIAAGFLKFRTNTMSFVISCAFAVTFTCLGAYFDGRFATISVATGVIGSSIGFFGAHYIQKYCGVKMPRLEQLQHNKTSTYVRRENSITKKLAHFIRNASIRDIMRYVDNKAKRYNTWFELSGAAIVIFCTYPLLVYPSTVYDAFSGTLRYMSSALALFICFVELWPKRLKEKLLGIYWYSLLTISFPILSGYMLCLHANMFWTINYLMGLLLLVALTDWIVFMIIGSVGTVFGLLLAVGFSSTCGLHSSIYSIMVLTVGLSAIGYLKSLREKSIVRRDRMIAHIAHELRSPLATIQSGLEIMYSPMKNPGDDQGFSLSQVKYEMVKSTLEGLQDISHRGLGMVEILLAKLRHQENKADIDRYSMQQCVRSVVSNYRFDKSALDRIKYNPRSNFVFEGSLIFTKHILLNILDNALKYSGVNTPIEISIKNQSVHIKDYGKGIPPEQLPYIFDALYTQERSGTGLGLAFCKEAMEGMNGTIFCHSKLGEFTEFILTFPVVKK